MRADHENKFLISTKRDSAFLTNGFSYWKEATTALNRYQVSDCHREATEAIITLPQQVSDIGEIMSNEVKQQKAENRKMLLTIYQNIRYLARQGLPFRVVKRSTATFISFCC